MTQRNEVTENEQRKLSSLFVSVSPFLCVEPFPP